MYHFEEWYNYHFKEWYIVTTTLQHGHPSFSRYTVFILSFFIYISNKLRFFSCGSLGCQLRLIFFLQPTGDCDGVNHSLQLQYLSDVVLNFSFDTFFLPLILLEPPGETPPINSVGFVFVVIFFSTKWWSVEFQILPFWGPKKSRWEDLWGKSISTVCLLTPKRRQYSSDVVW